MSLPWSSFVCWCDSWWPYLHRFWWRWLYQIDPAPDWAMILCRGSWWSYRLRPLELLLVPWVSYPLLCGMRLALWWVQCCIWIVSFPIFPYCLQEWAVVCPTVCLLCSPLVFCFGLGCFKLVDSDDGLALSICTFLREVASVLSLIFTSSLGSTIGAE